MLHSSPLVAQPLSEEAFDAEQPQEFYLADEDMAALADATLVVDGERLPVHSQAGCAHCQLHYAPVCASAASTADRMF